MSEEVIKVEALPHHIRQHVCRTRSPYRRGRKERAVKVYTISDESKYLLIQRVPDIKCDIKQELQKLCQRFGSIERLVLTDYPNCEEFTKTYLIKYKKFLNAIKAKKTLDDHNFLGSILHVCYAPEFETIDETREKLDIRRRYLPRSLDNKSAVTQRTDRKSIPNIDHKSDEIPVRPVVQTSDEIPVKSNAEFKRKLSEISDDFGESQTQTQKRVKEPKVTPKIRWRTKTSID